MRGECFNQTHRSQPYPLMKGTRSMDARKRGFTLVELLVVIAIIGMLVAILLPAIQTAREAARRTHCANNLKQLGLAIQNYHAAKKRYPPGSVMKPAPKSQRVFGDDGVFTNGFTEMLPFLEESALYSRYEQNKPWYMQQAAVARTPVPVLHCPSNERGSAPYQEVLFREFVGPTQNSPIGDTLATTDYILSKGASDSFCNNPENMPAHERGMFDYYSEVSYRKLKDGASKTFAVGEGASGPRWKLCSSPNCDTADLPMPDPTLSTTPFYARQFWIGGGNLAKIFKSFRWAAAGPMGCTVRKLNENPVTHFLFDDKAGLGDCRGTLTRGSENTHRVPNFRSDHPGGGYFLFADGAVDFVNEEIEIHTYRGLSTIAGGEVVRRP
jgi:prepilin-type N-terminal cleavage/methylation domain-containing protein/prepilin-type processing-associated H-X9-DG protein